MGQNTNKNCLTFPTVAAILLPFFIIQGGSNPVPAAISDLSPSGPVAELEQIRSQPLPEPEVPYSSSAEEHEIEEEEEEEEECSDGQYFHLRGQRCVPLVCIGGNKYRDFGTGECVIKHHHPVSSQMFGGGFGGGGRFMNRNGPGRSNFKPGRGRLRFTIPTKLKG